MRRRFAALALPSILNSAAGLAGKDRKSTRLNSSHLVISYAVFCLKKKNIESAQTQHDLFVRHVRSPVDVELQIRSMGGPILGRILRLPDARRGDIREQQCQYDWDR